MSDILERLRAYTAWEGETQFLLNRDGNTVMRADWVRDGVGVMTDIIDAAAEIERLRVALRRVLDAFMVVTPEEVILAREAGERTHIGDALEAAQELLEPPR